MSKLLLFLLGWFGFYMDTVQSHAAKKDSSVLIIFDFGNVVGKTNLEKLSELVEKELGISKEESKNLVYAFKKKTLPKDEFWETYAQDNRKELPQGWKERFNTLKRLVIESDPEVIQLVKELHDLKYKTAILSNTTPERAAHIRRLGFYDYFDPVILSCEIGVEKPQKEAFEVLLEQAQVVPGQCVYIDDKQKNIEMAALLGFDAILFTSIVELRLELEKRSILPCKGI